MLKAGIVGMPNVGELVLATPCTWLEEFTQKENWPQGRTLDWLKKELANDFELIEVADEPFLNSPRLTLNTLPFGHH